MKRVPLIMIVACLALNAAAHATLPQQITDEQKRRTTAVWDDLMRDIQPYRESLASWSVEYDGNKWYAQNRVMPSTPDEYRKVLADLAAIEKIITSEKYAGLIGFFGPDDDIIHRPQHWLEICQARVEITQRVLKRELSKILMPHTLPLRSMARSVRDFDGWGLSETGLAIVMGRRDAERKKVFGKVSDLFQAVNLSSETVRAEDWEKACDELVAAAREMAPRVKPAATYRITSIESPLRQRWASGPWKDRKILKINTESDQWKITRNAVGTPLYRTVGVVVQFEMAGFSYLIEYSTQIRENYAGGKYTYVTSNIAPDYRIVTKK